MAKQAYGMVGEVGVPIGGGAQITGVVDVAPKRHIMVGPIEVTP